MSGWDRRVVQRFGGAASGNGQVDQAGGQTARPDAVEIGEGARVGRRGDPGGDGPGDDTTPGGVGGPEGVDRTPGTAAGGDPLTAALVAVFAATYGFMLPISTSANAICQSSGRAKL